MKTSNEYLWDNSQPSINIKFWAGVSTYKGQQEAVDEEDHTKEQLFGVYGVAYVKDTESIGSNEGWEDDSPTVPDLLVEGNIDSRSSHEGHNTNKPHCVKSKSE